jgi:membrane protease YdiL (CAAX protease family)
MTAAFSTLRSNLRESRLMILAELLLVAAVFVADQYHLILISKTPYLLVLAALSLWLRKVRWRDIGFCLPANWLRLVLAGVALGIGMEALELFVTQPALVALTGQQPDLTEPAKLAANWKIFLVALGLTWTLGAFGEELVWRGWILNRFFDLLGSGRAAGIISLVIMSVGFGLAHAYQGVTGVTENVIAGLILGGAYLASGRNLIVPIVAHGMTDTIDFSLIVAGLYPGL